MSTQHYDALILGSGQSGTPLATHLKSLGLSTCLVERSHIGGCCVNEGCTPTKTMVASGRIAYLARRAAEYGVHSASGEDGHPRIDMQRIRERKRAIVKSFRGGSERRVGNAGVDVLDGEGGFSGEKQVTVKLNAGGEKTVTAERVYINVGCRPSRPHVPGLDDVDQARVLDSTSIQELGEVPKHLVVLGGGYIGLEFGQLFRRLGAEVTIVQRGERLGNRKDDPELVECLQGILKEDGIQLLLNHPQTSISTSSDPDTPITVQATSSGNTTTDIKASHILLSTGRIPNTDSLSPEKAGVKVDGKGYIVAEPDLSTSANGIYVMGDVKGGPAFTHVSYDDFRIIRDNLSTSSSKTSDGGAILTTQKREAYTPSVVYTDPQFAHVGPLLGALPPGHYHSYSMPGSWIARGLETEETRGMLKAVVEADSGKIVSFSAISPEGGEIMAVVQMAIVGGLTWKVLQDMVFAHPSWSESLNNIWGGDKKDFTV